MAVQTPQSFAEKRELRKKTRNSNPSAEHKTLSSLAKRGRSRSLSPVDKNPRCTDTREDESRRRSQSPVVTSCGKSRSKTGSEDHDLKVIFLRNDSEGSLASNETDSSDDECSTHRKAKKGTRNRRKMQPWKIGKNQLRDESLDETANIDNDPFSSALLSKINAAVVGKQTVRFNDSERENIVSKTPGGKSSLRKWLGRKQGNDRDSTRTITSADDLLETASSTDSVEIGSIIKESARFSSSKITKQLSNASFAIARSFSMASNKPPSETFQSLDTEMKTETDALLSRGDTHASKDEFDEAIRCYMKVIEMYQISEVSNDHPAIALAVDKLRDTHDKYSSIQNSDNIIKMGQEQENMGRYTRAVKSYTVGFRLRRAALGGDHPSLAKSLNFLGAVQSKRGYTTEGIKFLQMALELQQKHLEYDSDNSFLLAAKAITIRNFGYVYELKGKFDNALAMYHVSLDLHKQSRRKSESIPERTDEADVLDNLVFEASPSSHGKHLRKEGGEGMEVILHSSLGMYDIDLSQRVHGTSREQSYEADVGLGVTLHSIGHILAPRFARHSMALRAYESSLVWMKATLGEDHANVAVLLANIGNLLKEMGDFEGASVLYNDVLRLEKSNFGDSHAEVAVTLHNIGTIEYSRGKYTAAIDAFQQAMRIHIQVYEMHSPFVAVASNSIGQVCEKIDDTEQALLAYNVTLGIYKVNLEEKHLDIAQLCQKIGIIHYQKAGQYEEAKAYCEEALRLYKMNMLRENHSLVREVINNLADINGAMFLESVATNPASAMLLCGGQ